MNIFETFRTVQAFVFNLDGVLASRQILVTGSGEYLRAYDIQDSWAIRAAIKANYPIALLTSTPDIGIKKHVEELGASLLVNNDIQGPRKELTDWATRFTLNTEHILYMGDDLPDLPDLRIMGIKACPADATEEVKQVAHYISAKTGGNGAVRDVIEKTMKLQKEWPILF